MKTTTSALATYLNSFSPSADQHLNFCDLFTITLQAGSTPGIANGQVLGYATLPLPVLWNGNTYLSNSVQVSGLKYKSTTGTEVDTQQITLVAYASQTIGGIPFLQALQQGLLDGAEIQRERAFFVNYEGVPPLVPLGTVILFKGRVTKIDAVGRTTAKVTVESDLTLLKMQMPWKFFSTNCVWQLYGPGCTLLRSAHTYSGAVGSSSTASAINWSGASANFQQGSITFTSGANEGVTSTIKTATTGALTLIYPLPNAPADGDTFSAVWGCDHTQGAQGCAKFSNLVNYLGFPYVPPPQIISGPLSSTANAGKG